MLDIIDIEYLKTSAQRCEPGPVCLRSRLTFVRKWLSEPNALPSPFSSFCIALFEDSFVVNGLAASFEQSGEQLDSAIMMFYESVAKRLPNDEIRCDVLGALRLLTLSKSVYRHGNAYDLRADYLSTSDWLLFEPSEVESLILNPEHQHSHTLEVCRFLSIGVRYQS